MMKLVGIVLYLLLGNFYVVSCGWYLERFYGPFHNKRRLYALLMVVGTVVTWYTYNNEINMTILPYLQLIITGLGIQLTQGVKKRNLYFQGFIWIMTLHLWQFLFTGLSCGV